MELSWGAKQDTPRRGIGAWFGGSCWIGLGLRLCRPLAEEAEPQNLRTQIQKCQTCMFVNSIVSLADRERFVVLMEA